MKLYIILCINAVLVNSRPISQLKCDKECQQEYLIKYGYIQPQSQDVSNLIDNLTDGILNLQKDAGLEQTGIMDSKTLNLMQAPRCGVKFDHRRQKRFTINYGWKTPKTHHNETVITWHLDFKNFDKINTTLSKSHILSIFSNIFEKWSNTSLLLFKEISEESKANITIQFEGGDHKDNFPFDGPGNVLAHAFFPGSRRGGDAHFDLGEEWTLWGEDKGVSLYAVGIHEIGHSLGLSHSSVQESVMYAWYSPNHTDLHEDDNLGMNSLYGVRPQYKFGVLDPKYRVYKTTTPPKTTTYKMDKIRKLIIQNSRVLIYPKSSSSLSL